MESYVYVCIYVSNMCRETCLPHPHFTLHQLPDKFWEVVKERSDQATDLCIIVHVAHVPSRISLKHLKPGFEKSWFSHGLPPRNWQFEWGK